SSDLRAATPVPMTVPPPSPGGMGGGTVIGTGVAALPGDSANSAGMLQPVSTTQAGRRTFLIKAWESMEEGFSLVLRELVRRGDQDRVCKNSVAMRRSGTVGRYRCAK